MALTFEQELKSWAALYTSIVARRQAGSRRAGPGGYFRRAAVRAILLNWNKGLD